MSLKKIVPSIGFALFSVLVLSFLTMGGCQHHVERGSPIGETPPTRQDSSEFLVSQSILIVPAAPHLLSVGRCEDVQENYERVEQYARDLRGRADQVLAETETAYRALSADALDVVIERDIIVPPDNPYPLYLPLADAYDEGCKHTQENFAEIESWAGRLRDYLIDLTIAAQIQNRDIEAAFAGG